MILKVKGISGRRSDWWIFECYKIHYEYKTVFYPDGDSKRCMTYHDLDHPEGSNDPEFVSSAISWGDMSHNVSILKDNSEVNPRPVIVAHLGTEQDQEYIVAFDTIAYLCNDKGETIEKIEP